MNKSIKYTEIRYLKCRNINMLLISWFLILKKPKNIQTNLKLKCTKTALC